MKTVNSFPIVGKTIKDVIEITTLKKEMLCLIGDPISGQLFSISIANLKEFIVSKEVNNTTYSYGYTVNNDDTYYNDNRGIGTQHLISTETIQFSWSFLTSGIKIINTVINNFDQLSTIDWGDGNATEFMGFTSSSHNYTAAGSYLVTINLGGDLVKLNLDERQLTSFTPVALPNNLIQLMLYSNELTSDNVNAILEYLDSEGYTNFLIYMHLQTPLAPPSGDGIVAKNNLVARGGGVVTD